MDLIAQKKSFGFDNQSYAFQFPMGDLGFKDKLVAIHITSTSNINGIPAGNPLEDYVGYSHQSGMYQFTKDSLINILNKGGLCSDNTSPFIDPLLISIPGSSTDSTMQFTFSFLFENSLFEKTTETLTWVP
jgi:hypothetical protein